MTDPELADALTDLAALLRHVQALCAYALTPPDGDGGERMAA